MARIFILCCYIGKTESILIENPGIIDQYHSKTIKIERVGYLI